MGLPNLQRSGLLDQDDYHYSASLAFSDIQGAAEDQTSQEHEAHEKMKRRTHEKCVWVRRDNDRLKPLRRRERERGE